MAPTSFTLYLPKSRPKDRKVANEGRQTSRTEILPTDAPGTASGEQLRYVWDHRGRLRRVETYQGPTGAKLAELRFMYDSLDRRIQIRSDANADGTFENTERFIYDGDEIILAQRTAAGQAGALTTSYLHGPAVDEVFAEQTFSSTPGVQAGPTLWTLADQQGTARDIVFRDAAGETQIAYRQFFATFGERTRLEDHSAGIGLAPPPRFAFTGRELDPGGLQYHHARYYDPATGTFLSPDPLGPAGGDSNPYRYALNNPTTYVDRSGLSPALPNPFDGGGTFGGFNDPAIALGFGINPYWGGSSTPPPSVSPYSSSDALATTAASTAASAGGFTSWIWSGVQSAGSAIYSAVQRADQFAGQLNTAAWTGQWVAPDVTSGASAAWDIGVGLRGGGAIVANTATFGGTDYLGVTNSNQYQGWEYDASRISAAFAREAALSALSLGTANSAVRSVQAINRGLDIFDTARSAYDLGIEARNAWNGESVNLVNVATGAIGFGGVAFRATSALDGKASQALPTSAAAPSNAVRTNAQLERPSSTSSAGRAK